MNRDRILILGDGFLGNAFKRHGYENVWGREKFQWQGGCNLFEKCLQDERFDVVINTIGISDTRYCEDFKNWEEVHSTNSLLPKFLSDTCGWYDRKFVHISTGCLYDTLNVPQSEEEPKSAHCNYVISKWIGEMGCANNDLIIRPRLLFDSEVPKNNKRNNLLCKLEKFTEFVGERNSITSNDTIVEAIESLLENNQSGIFNVAQTGSYTIAEIAEFLGLTINRVLSQDELRKDQGLALVNNIMDLNKLEKFYKPRETLEEVERCWKILHKNT